MGSNSHRSTCCFAILAVFGHLLPFFLFWTRFQEISPFFNTKKITAFRIWSQIHNILPNGALRIAKRHFLGIIWPKLPFLPMGPTLKYTFLFDSWWVATVTGVAVVLPFWLFLGIFWHFFILVPNHTNKAIFQYKKITAFRIWSQICNISPYGALRVAKWHLWGIFGSKMQFCPWGPSLNIFSFQIPNRSNSHMCSCYFTILALFGHLLAIFQFMWIWVEKLKVQLFLHIKWF